MAKKTKRAKPRRAGRINSPARQAGVIAYRVHDGVVQVLLLTSRRSRRWIIPKGNIDAGATVVDAAANEAFEEAGIEGEMQRLAPFGFYDYAKVLRSGAERATVVEVYLLRVRRERKKWPEMRARERKWVSTEEALRTISEPGLVPLLKRVIQLEPILSAP